jgi:predicted transcriptional regulator
MKWSEYLVAQLSEAASQVLLALLLAGQRETGLTLEEFATRTNLTKHLIVGALSELELVSLIQMIPEEAQKVKVRLVYEEYEEDEAPAAGHTKVTEETDLPLIAGAAEKPLLRQPAGEGDVSVAAGVPREREVAALRLVWDEAFPVSEYPEPQHRLHTSTAKAWLQLWGMEYVACIIRQVAAQSGRLNHAPSYVAAVLKKERPCKRGGAGGEEDGPGIDDELRQFTELARRQVGVQHTGSE